MNYARILHVAVLLYAAIAAVGWYAGSIIWSNYWRPPQPWYGIAVVAQFLGASLIPLVSVDCFKRREWFAVTTLVYPILAILFPVVSPAFGISNSIQQMQTTVYGAVLLNIILFVRTARRPTRMRIEMLGCGNPPICLGERRLWIVAVMPISVAFMTWLVAPGYIAPFINQPSARVLYAFFWLSNFIGLATLWKLRSRSRFKFALSVCATWLFFSLPVILVPCLSLARTVIGHCPGPELSDEAAR